MTIQSKQILPAMGYLSIDFSFRAMELPRRRKAFFTSGTSKVTKNVKIHYKRIMRNAIWNGVKKIFPNQSVTPHKIIILTYNIVYFIERYEITERKGKYYEKWRDKQAKKTRYSVISDKKEYSVEQEGYN